MTFIDILLLIALVVLMYMSFDAGILKVGSILIGMYGGLQVAILFYSIFGRLTGEGDANSQLTSEILWFFALWVVWSIIFGLIAWSFIGKIGLPKWANNIDQLLGLGMGVLAAVFALWIVSTVFKNTFNIIWISAGRPDNWMLAIKTGFDNSALLRVFDVVRVVYLTVLSPWLPSKNIPGV